MRRKRIIVLLFIITFIIVSLYFQYLQVRPMKHPEPIEYSVLINLERPDRGIIYISYPPIFMDKFDIAAHAYTDASRILDQQYYIPYKDIEEIEVQEKNGRYIVSFEFFAKNKYEFIWPVCTFNSSFISFYEIVNFTVILPEDYEVVNITARGTVSKPTKTFEDRRWKISTTTQENSAFKIEIIYKKT